MAHVNLVDVKLVTREITVKKVKLNNKKQQKKCSYPTPLPMVGWELIFFLDRLVSIPKLNVQSVLFFKHCWV